MKFHKYFYLFIVLFHSWLCLYAQSDPLYWPIGETLTYKVKYAFIRLGTLSMVVKDTLRIDEKRVYHIQLFVDSSPMLFWVNQHSLYESMFSDQFEGFLFKYDETVDETPFNGEYVFDYSDSLIHIQVVAEKNPDSLIVTHNPFTGIVLDGVSLLYYARQYAYKTIPDTVQYLADAGEETAILDFQGKGKPLSVRGVDEKIPSYYLEGRMTGEGIAGLSGYFKGWFSTDDQRVPLKAKLKVFLGYVTLKLESWEGWSPELP